MSPESLLGAAVAVMVVSLVVGLGAYILAGLAFGAVFRKFGGRPVMAWIPILNLVEMARIARTAVGATAATVTASVVLSLAGSILSGAGSDLGVALTGLGALASIAAWILFIVQAHRLGLEHRIPGAMAVVAALAPLVWACVVGWSRMGTAPEPGPITGAIPLAATGHAGAAPAPVAAPVAQPASSLDNGASDAVPAEPEVAPMDRFPLPGVPAAPVPLPPPPPAELAVDEDDAETRIAPPAPVPASPYLAPGTPPPPPAFLGGGSPVPPPPPVSPYLAGGAAVPPPPPPAIPLPPAAPASGQPAPFGIPAAPPVPPAPPAPAAPVAAFAAAPPAPPAAEAAAETAAPEAPELEDAPALQDQDAEAPEAPSMFAPSAAAPVASAPSLFAPVTPPAAPATGPAAGPAASTPWARAAAPAAVATIDADQAVDEDDDDDHTQISSRRRETWELVTGDGDVYPLTSGVVQVGRPGGRTPADGSTRVEIVDPTKTISKIHARLILEGATWSVEDLGSTNGTALIAADGTETELEPRTPTEVAGRLLLGDVELELRRSGGA